VANVSSEPNYTVDNGECDSLDAQSYIGSLKAIEVQEGEGAEAYCVPDVHVPASDCVCDVHRGEELLRGDVNTATAVVTITETSGVVVSGSSKSGLITAGITVPATENGNVSDRILSLANESNRILFLAKNRGVSDRIRSWEENRGARDKHESKRGGHCEAVSDEMRSFLILPEVHNGAGQDWNKSSRVISAETLNRNDTSSSPAQKLKYSTEWSATAAGVRRSCIVSIVRRGVIKV
jgi:hypothetical protein